ncbi:PE family protein [Mycobacterium sp. 050134]
MVTAPESVTSAAGTLASIGSSLQEATAGAAAHTTGVASAAADEISLAISELFGTYGQEFQALTAQATAFHDEFVRLLNGGAAAYVGAEVANAEQTLLGNAGLGGAGSAGAMATGAAAAVPGGAYAQLFANTTANLQSLFGTWAAHPFPFLRQVLANQLGYLQQAELAVNGTIANLPAVLANLPATIEGLLSLNPAQFIQQFITTQVGFAQDFVTSAANMVTGIVNGLPAFEAQLRVAFQAVLAGNFNGAVIDVAQAYANLLVTGVDPGTLALNLSGTIIPPNLVATLVGNPTLLGPLGDLFSIMNIPGQEAQYFTNLLPPGSIPQQMAQNVTNVLNALTVPSIRFDVSVPVFNPPAVQYNAFFGLPLVITYALAGAPIATLNGIASSATAVQQALLAGDGVGAIGALFDAPAIVANGFLNSDTLIDMSLAVPTGASAPFPTVVTIALHLPFDGILVAPHPITATVNVPGFEAFGFPTTVTVGGTPFMGLVPLLVNYLPQQLANAITPG